MLLFHQCSKFFQKFAVFRDALFLSRLQFLLGRLGLLLECTDYTLERNSLLPELLVLSRKTVRPVDIFRIARAIIPRRAKQKSQ